MRRVLAIAFVFLLTCCSCSSEATKAPYRLGNFASAPTSSSTPRPKTLPRLSVKSIMTNISQLWRQYARYFRICVFIYYTRESVDSILEDTWEAVRDPDRVFGQQIHRVGERKVVLRRTRKSEALRALIGAGYTPRLVWLFGVMLRGIVHCTALPQIFSPPIGFGSGAVAAARFAHREWLPCIMLGWYGSGFYWKTLFGVNGPPPTGFDGVPIKIRHVRVV
jgi:hypothetical protein